jgi:hypothetical protein
MTLLVSGLYSIKRESGDEFENVKVVSLISDWKDWEKSQKKTRQEYLVPLQRLALPCLYTRRLHESLLQTLVGIAEETSIICFELMK